MMNIKDMNNAVIILAGGKSQRAETLKGLRQIRNEYWIDLQINYFKKIGVKQIYVGLGYDSQKYLSFSTQIKSVNHAVNPYPENGSFSTLLVALSKALKNNWEKILLIYVDHALPNTTSTTKLLQQSNFDVVKPVYASLSGHPIVLSRNFCRALQNKPYTSQLNTEIKKIPINRVNYIEVDDAMIHENLNTQVEWENYLNHAEI